MPKETKSPPAVPISKAVLVLRAFCDSMCRYVRVFDLKTDKAAGTTK